MSEYQQRRDEIKRLITVQLILAEERPGVPPNLVLNQLLGVQAGEMLERYEELTIGYLKTQSRLLPEPPTYSFGGFMWGVGQGFVASIAFVAFLYGAAYLLKMTNVDAFSPLRQEVPKAATSGSGK